MLSFGLVAGCLIWIPISIGIVVLVGWMIQDEVDVMVGLGGIALSLAIGAMSLISKDQAMAPFLFVASVSILVLVPLAKTQREKRAHAALDLEQLEKAYAFLVENPNNVGARLKIGKTLYDRGAHGPAIVLVENALQGMPRNAFEQEYRMLNQWKRTSVAVPVPEITCIICGAKNKAGEPLCFRCGAPILLHYARGQWMSQTAFRKLLLIWIAAAVPIIGIPFAGMNLPPNKTTPMVVLLLSFSAYVVWLALRKPRRRFK